ncbi:MAG: hypothetical protein ACP5R5_10640 [Armatimonadota bacterium]
MKELLARESFEKVMLLSAVAGPLFGIVIGTMIGAHERCALPKVLAGGLLGSLLTVVYGMWHIFGAVTDALGLDSVGNLIIELILFAAVGAIIGLAAFGISVALRRRA